LVICGNLAKTALREILGRFFIHIIWHRAFSIRKTFFEIFTQPFCEDSRCIQIMACNGWQNSAWLLAVCGARAYAAWARKLLLTEPAPLLVSNDEAESVVLSLNQQFF
jgi:hypothetical protein